MPEEMVTALTEQDYSGKIIKPFITHEGSGLANIPNQIKNICSGATVLEGLAIRGSSVKNSSSRIEDWLNN